MKSYFHHRLLWTLLCVATTACSNPTEKRAALGAPGTPVDDGDYSSQTSVELSWTAPADPGKGVASYHLQVGTVPELADLYDIDVGDVLLHSVSGVHGQTLYARVAAVDILGDQGPWSGTSDGITIDTTAPDAPGVPTDGGDFALSSSVSFQWGAATDQESGIQAYHLQVGSSPAASDVFAGRLGPSLSYTVTGTEGQSLFARVAAENGAGIVGPWSQASDGIKIPDCGDNTCEGPENRANCLLDCVSLTPEERNLLEGALDRIRQHRKGPVTIRIEDATGNPVIGANVSLEQREHAFLFGAQHTVPMLRVILEKEFGIPYSHDVPYELIDEYLARMAAFANYNFARMNWNWYEPEDDQVDYELWHAIIDWFREDGYHVHANSIVWNINTPDWVPSDCDAMILELKERLTDVLTNFTDDFREFGIINELTRPFRDGFLADKMTPCIQQMGNHAWGKLFFEHARSVAPDAKLRINECCGIYDLDYHSLLDFLRDSTGKPLFDVVGIQTHMFKSLLTLDTLWLLCESYSDFDKPIHFTEVTVLSGTPMGGDNPGMVTTPEGERQQADYLVKFYTLLFSHPAVESIRWWSFSDLRSYKDAPGGLLRPDMTPKPSYDALMELIYEVWWTEDTGITDDLGAVTFEGFWGDYDVVVTDTTTGNTKTFNLNLAPDGATEVSFTLD